MQNKKLEKMIKNLQRVIDHRKSNEEKEFLKTLQHELEKEDEPIVPLSISFSTCGFITNGLIGGLFGFILGRTIDEISSRNETAYNIIGGILDIVHNANLKE